MKLEGSAWPSRFRSEPVPATLTARGRGDGASVWPRLLQRIAPAVCAVLAVAAIHWLGTPAQLAGHRRPAVLVVLVLASLVLVGLPGIACAALLGRRSTPTLSLGAVVVGSGLGGWLLFWAVFAGLGRTAGAAAAALVAISVLVLAFRPLEWAARGLAMPLLATSLLAVAYVALAGDHGGLGAGSDMVGHRYWVIVDAGFPQIFAVKLLDHPETLRPFLAGDWQTSDRPPLMVGMMLSGFPFVPSAGRAMMGWLLALAANISWVLGLWSLLRALRVPDGRIGLVMVSVAVAGAVYVNTVYTAPKMLAGGLGLVAAAALLDQTSRPWLRLSTAGAAAALALLSHGSTLFWLVAMLGLTPFVWKRRGGLRWTHILLGVCVAAILYAPWVAFQHYYNPPGDRLIKWHLAGNDIFVRDQRPPLQSILSAYRSAGLGQLLENKLTNVRVVIGDQSVWNGERVADWTPGWDGSLAGQIREVLLWNLGPVPCLLLLGAPLLLLRRVRRAPWCGPVVMLTSLSAAAYVLLEWGGSKASSAWEHTAPYSLLLLWCALGALAAGEVSRRLLVALTIAQAALFVGLWVAGVTLQSAFTAADPGQRDRLLDLLAAGSFAALAALPLVRATVRQWLSGQQRSPVLAPAAHAAGSQ